MNSLFATVHPKTPYQPLLFVRQIGAQHVSTRDSLIRNLILLGVMDYWDQHGHNWTPPQATLEAHVKKHVPLRVYDETIRDVLGELVSHGFLSRNRLGQNNLSYRLSPQYANILSASFSRPDLLKDPIPWVTRSGRFLNIGLPQDPRPRLLPLPSHPHYFAQHTWLRGAIHGAHLGAFNALGDPLPVWIRSVREAPLQVLWTFWDQPPGKRRSEAARLIEETSLFQRFRRAAARNLQWAGDADRGRWLEDGPEEALAMLHLLCGHDMMELVTKPPRLHETSRWRRLLDERRVYTMLDAAVRTRMQSNLASAAQKAPSPGSASRDPSIADCEAFLRETPAVRRALRAYRLAWPRTLYSPAW